MLLSLLILPLSASAKLWGWPDEFSVHKMELKQNWPPGSHGEAFYMCPGWDNWCKGVEGGCEEMQHFKPSGRLASGSIYMQKANAAWMDLWRVGDTTTYDMYEQNGDGAVHGQCQLTNRAPHDCDNTFFTSSIVQVYLHCWQW